ncbi:MAG TPA: hypothetical protein VMR75_01105 [Candidatus Saccharimonadales bacterium]|nr:hypothetical protein [Candidatus Saccharimonadales bacterium]
MSTDTAIGLPEDLAESLAAYLANLISLRHAKVALSLREPFVDVAAMKNLLMKGYGYLEYGVWGRHALIMFTDYRENLCIECGYVIAKFHGVPEYSFSVHHQTELPNQDRVASCYGFQKTVIYQHHSDEPSEEKRSHTCVVINLEDDLKTADFIQAWEKGEPLPSGDENQPLLFIRPASS